MTSPRDDDAGGDALAGFDRLRRGAAEGLLAGRRVLAAAVTATRTDAGGWLGPAKVCACLTDEELLLFAVRPGPKALLARWGIASPPAPGYAEAIPMADLAESTYNHVTGRLLLAPAAAARLRRLKLPPLPAHRLLRRLKATAKDTDHA